VVAALLQADRYLVTPAPGNDDQAWLQALALALGQGVRRVQLRAGEGIDLARWRGLAVQAVARCREAGADVLVNGDIALAQDLDVGVHLRAAQLPQLDQRPLPAGRIVAASCHDDADLRHAERLRCDFAVLGPLRPTPTHPQAPGIGWARFAALRERVSLPLYAIGGLSPTDIDDARAHGAQGIAAIRALWPAPLP
jgi:8-oxo-dGTP diphosphatase